MARHTRHSKFNPGALEDVDRFTEEQPIVPGGSRYDLVRHGGQGRKVPAVGDYPSGAPGGIGGGHSRTMTAYLAQETGLSEGTIAILSAVIAVGAIAGFIYWEGA